MATKWGGTLVAATNAQVAGAKADRMSVAVINGSTTDTIFVEFGAAASTVVGDASWRVPPSGSLFLNSFDYPAIRGTINLKSSGTPEYFVATDNG